MRRGRGFTLIELLVVIAIIAILAAILFPVFARAREKARQTSCLNNCKQSSLAVLMYVQDYDGTYPQCWTFANPNTNRHAFQKCMPYIKNVWIFMCPSADLSRYSTEQWEKNNGFSLFMSGKHGAYGYNTALGGFDWDDWTSAKYVGTVWEHGVNEAQIDRPAHCIMLGDSKGFSGLLICPPRDRAYDNCIHNGGANLAFCDGHGKWAKKNSEMLKDGVNNDWWYPNAQRMP